MKSGHLSQYFNGVAGKRLSAVEVNPKVSHQHEFGGVTSLRQILGDQERTFPARFIYLTDDQAEPETIESSVTWYDSRKNQPHRNAEFRMYYPSSSIMERTTQGDFLLVAQRKDGSLLVIIADEGTTAENQIRMLFGLHGDGTKYEVRTEKDADKVELGFVGKLILELIGVEIEETAPNYLEIMLDKFKGSFPTTKLFSGFARETLPEVRVQAASDSDAALIAWMEWEETLFRTLERHFVGQRLKNGFGPNGDDVDEFVAFSLSVHNRRKSRVGHALENHLEAVFQGCGVQYSRTKETENKAKPDFLFPSVEKYHLPTFSADLLTVLGVKSSCKDRWRQVLSEAKKIPQKHLLTLEPGISENQINEMKSFDLQLVIPSSLHKTYSGNQQSWLSSLSDFIKLVSDRQLQA